MRWTADTSLADRQYGRRVKASRRAREALGCCQETGRSADRKGKLTDCYAWEIAAIETSAEPLSLQQQIERISFPAVT